MKKLTKMITLVISLFLVASLLGGCGLISTLRGLVPATTSTDEPSESTKAPRTSAKVTASKTPESAAVNTSGNTPGNLSNTGLAAQQGDWIFYTITNDGHTGHLCKIRTDGTGQVMLSNDLPFYINVVGDWVYYVNYTGSRMGNIYKVRTDGTDRMQLNSDESGYLTVVGDWIYYLNGSDNNYLYIIRTDGTQKAKMTLANDPDIGGFNIADDWIYCIDSFLIDGLDDGCYIKKVHLDGTLETTVFHETAGCWSINVAGDWIYYLQRAGSDANGFGILYKVRTDGTGQMKICDDELSCINVVGDWIYYVGFDSSGHNGIYKIHTDGTEKAKLSEDPAGLINVAGDWIYYFSPSDNEAVTFYKIRTDGTDRQKVQ